MGLDSATKELAQLLDQLAFVDGSGIDSRNG